MISLLGKNIKAIRERKGISAYKLSQLSGVNQATISYLESGKRQTANSETVNKLANALNVEINDLYHLDDNESYIVSDLVELINVLLTSDELTLNGKPLSNIEREYFKEGVIDRIKKIEELRNE